MLFYVEEQVIQKPLKLIYRVQDYAFDVEPKPEGGGISLLVNDIQIEINDDGQLLYVWGLCSHTAWLDTIEPPPQYRSATLRAELPDDVVPGESIRINKERWPVTVNNQSGWVRVGDSIDGTDCIEFAQGMVACLSAGHLVNLWLKPTT